MNTNPAHPFFDGLGFAASSLCLFHILGTGREKNITVQLNPGVAFFEMKATVGN